jgi:putative methionine-R-sulfoxide reductase with GAF domain
VSAIIIYIEDSDFLVQVVDLDSHRRQHFDCISHDLIGPFFCT